MWWLPNAAKHMHHSVCGFEDGLSPKIDFDQMGPASDIAEKIRTSNMSHGVIVVSTEMYEVPRGSRLFKGPQN